MNPREKETGGQRLFFIIQSTQFLPSVFFSTLISSFYPLGEIQTQVDITRECQSMNIEQRKIIPNEQFIICLFMERQSSVAKVLLTI